MVVNTELNSPFQFKLLGLSYNYIVTHKYKYNTFADSDLWIYEEHYLSTYVSIRYWRGKNYNGFDLSWVEPSNQFIIKLQAKEHL